MHNIYPQVDVVRSLKTCRWIETGKKSTIQLSSFHL
jgi:hypothetical protein